MGRPLLIFQKLHFFEEEEEEEEEEEFINVLNIFIQRNIVFVIRT